MVDRQAIKAKSNNCQVWCCKSANPTPIVHPCFFWLGGSMYSNGLSMLISLGRKFLQDTQHKFYPTIQTTCQQVATGAHKLDIDLGLDWFLDLPMKKKKKKMLFIPALADIAKHCSISPDLVHTHHLEYIFLSLGCSVLFLYHIQDATSCQKKMHSYMDTCSDAHMPFFEQSRTCATQHPAEVCMRDTLIGNSRVATTATFKISSTY